MFHDDGWAISRKGKMVHGERPSADGVFTVKT